MLQTYFFRSKPIYLSYKCSLVTTLVIFIFGVLSFNKTEKFHGHCVIMQSAIKIENLFKEYKLGVLGREPCIEIYKVGLQK